MILQKSEICASVLLFCVAATAPISRGREVSANLDWFNQLNIAPADDDLLTLARQPVPVGGPLFGSSAQDPDLDGGAEPVVVGLPPAALIGSSAVFASTVFSVIRARVRRCWC